MKKSVFISSCGFFLAGFYPIFAEETEAPIMGDQSLWQTLLMVGIAIVFFYFILWRPEQKRRKALEEQRAKLSKGDKVTAMGIIGTVNSIKENSVILSMVDGAKIEVLKGAITEVGPTAGVEESKKE